MSAVLNPDPYRELLIGCGSRREKLLKAPRHETWSNLTTLDINADHMPDVQWDLGRLPLPFDAETFDEIHAYEVLEHIGAQGDYKTFFAQFSEFWRILKPGGYLCATCPSWKSMWAWGDPSHTRVMTSGSLVFLSQAQYVKQVGKTAMSDFRYLYKADFETAFVQEDDNQLAFVLRAIK